MHPDFKEILFDEETIINRSKELGKEISDHYRKRNAMPVVVGLLKGSVPFMAELIKHIDVDLEIDFMDVSSYNGINSTEVKIVKDMETLVTDREVLIVEDIIDTGKTLDKVVGLLKSRGAKDVKIATLLDKPERRIAPVFVDYVGFKIPDAFVIGYGLDYNQKYRNVPYVGIIKDEAI